VQETTASCSCAFNCASSACDSVPMVDGGVCCLAAWMLSIRVDAGHARGDAWLPFSCRRPVGHKHRLRLLCTSLLAHGPLRRGNYFVHRPPLQHPSSSLHTNCSVTTCPGDCQSTCNQAIHHADHHQRIRERLAPHKGRPPGALSTVQTAPGVA
jgi:hypothetical protein